MFYIGWLIEFTDLIQWTVFFYIFGNNQLRFPVSSSIGKFSDSLSHCNKHWRFRVVSPLEAEKETELATTWKLSRSNRQDGFVPRVAPASFLCSILRMRNFRRFVSNAHMGAFCIIKQNDTPHLLLAFFYCRYARLKQESGQKAIKSLLVAHKLKLIKIGAKLH